MAFIDTEAPDQAQGAVREMYLRQQTAWGYVPNYAKVFCHRPQVMARWGQLLAEIKRRMDKRLFELVTFVAAHELRHSACALAHGRALRQFFRDAQIFDLAAAASGRAFFTKILDALGVLPDSACLAFDELFRQTLTVGRAID